MQTSLLAQGLPSFEADMSRIQRRELTDGAWIDYGPGWLHGSQVLFEHLAATVGWSRQRRPMYDRIVDVPRLIVGWDPLEPAGAGVGETVPAIATALTQLYGEPLDRIALALYRDGRDSVAWHGDRNGRTRSRCLVATVSLGSPRRFLMRPARGGTSVRLRLGHGDLLVMGGTCQRTWEHCVPKTARAEPRLSIMFRDEHADGNATGGSPIGAMRS